jgi:hypothetical protein
LPGALENAREAYAERGVDRTIAQFDNRIAFPKTLVGHDGNAARNAPGLAWTQTHA